MEPVDLRGVPYVDNGSGTTKWAVPELFPHDEETTAILFLDELASAEQSLQDRTPEAAEAVIPEFWKDGSRWP